MLVLKWCDGTYLEDQDKFRMSGIFRDVYLLTRPQNHLRDFRMEAILEENLSKGMLRISGKYKGDEQNMQVSVLGPDKTIYQGSAQRGEACEIHIEYPQLWNPEMPVLYDVEIICGQEKISEQTGFRIIEIKDAIVTVNKLPVKLRGVNRHDSDPETGYTIRTSHYPNAPWFTQLCDRYGFFVISESDMEAHGAVSLYGHDEEDYMKRMSKTVENPLFEEAILDRTRLNVIRDKNRSCIIMWSLGNESGMSTAIEKTGRWVKNYDPKRMVHYESIHQNPAFEQDVSMLDVYSRMYHPLEEIKEYLSLNDRRPYMLCEYSHAMGNGPGDYEDYMELFLSEPRILGGCIWEWADHAVYDGVAPNGNRKYLYGGDFQEPEHDGNFCVDGMVFPDRTVSSSLKEYKNVIRPVRAELVDPEQGIVKLTNWLDFANLKGTVMVRYELACNGTIVETETLELVDHQPKDSKSYHIPYNMPETKAVVSLRLVYISTGMLHLRPAGEELGFDQFILREDYQLRPPVLSEKQLKWEENERYLWIKGENFTYQVDKFYGTFVSLRCAGKEYLQKPMTYNFTRAETDNDLCIKAEWEKAGYHQMKNRVMQMDVKTEERCCVIRCRQEFAPLHQRTCLELDSTWTIYPDGHIDVQASGKRNTEMPWLPRMGMRLILNPEFAEVNYLGFGPTDAYLDKHRAAWFGRHKSKVRDLHEDHIKPQENGSHFYTYELELREENGRGIEVYAETPISFQVSHYTQEQLRKAKHNFELEESGYTVLCLDYKMSGIGSGSCGYAPAEKYRMQEESFAYHMAWYLKKVY